jgi:[lysine-biosynthesis-protein LysW]---L-2-aminoadipate ligase
VKTIALLAERLRVEERQLMHAFAARGWDARLVAPSSLTHSLDGCEAAPATMVLDRSLATAESTLLAVLLSAAGATVVNRPATARLLADRVALIRHLVGAGLPVPRTAVCFGEESALETIDRLGYPAVLKTLTVDPAFPSAYIEDRDSAEALVEHRVTLGGERAMVAQAYIRSRHDRNVRAIVVGNHGPIAYDTRPTAGWRPEPTTSYTRAEHADSALAQVAAEAARRLGSGVYAIMMIESKDGPVITGAENLVDFRALSESGLDVAGAIVDHALFVHEHSRES